MSRRHDAWSVCFLLELCCCVLLLLLLRELCRDTQTRKKKKKKKKRWSVKREEFQLSSLCVCVCVGGRRTSHAMTHGGIVEVNNIGT